jgi:hypothetical protein
MAIKLSGKDTFGARQRHAEFPEKELVTAGFAAILCGSLTKENLWHAFVN